MALSEAGSRSKTTEKSSPLRNRIHLRAENAQSRADALFPTAAPPHLVINLSDICSVVHIATLYPCPRLELRIGSE